MPKQQFHLMTPVFGAAIVMYGGMGSIALAESRIPASSELSFAGISESNRFIPKKALMAISIPTDGKAWSQLERFHTPKTKRIFDREVAAFLRTGFPKNDYAKEIQPWLGNVTMAILPNSIGSQPKTESKYHFILVTEVKDLAAVAKYLDKEKVRDGGRVVAQKNYKGIEIVQIDREYGSSFVYALADRFLVLSDRVTALEQAIDTYKDGGSIVPALVTDKVEIENPIFQLYMPNFAESIQQIDAQSTDPTELPPQFLAQLKKVKSVNLGVGIDSAGIRTKVTSRLTSDLAWEFQPAPGKVVAQLPFDTFALVTGSNISDRWRQFNRDVQSFPELKSLLDTARQGLQSFPLQLDLDKDIFGWMDGEFAFGAIPVKEGILGEFGTAPIFIQQTSDRRTANLLFQKVEKLASGYGLVTIATRNIKGVSVTQWTLPGAPEPIVSYGWYANNTLFVTIGEQLVRRMTNRYNEPLTLNSDFQAAIASLSKPNLGYFYLDMDKTWAAIDKYLPKETKSEINPEVNAILGRIRGLGVTVSMSSPSTHKLEMLLSLKPRGLRNVWY
ncbi:DUF3352 domain-containing protein [Pseudanabaena sp. PCC 6802]|uniref:DUF3352 domain-containing protein n=1 Tax=Pseudanabaena sp. PCC 6802 TaxID=118173 RepID=UPI00034DC07B|nr:DUF3352 domain-containing protein [Pseudanabaena sp. PCC 6802]